VKRTLIRYKTKPDLTGENERLIRNVFQELQQKSPAGVRYMALKLGDGTFVHFVMVDSEDGASPLPGLPAFQAFQNGIKERCAEAPQVSEAIIVGDYRMLGG
jgi:hypothetical protein